LYRFGKWDWANVRDERSKAQGQNPHPSKIEECGTRKFTPRSHWTWGVMRKGAPPADL
jgi:hypothetical protein